MIYDFMGSLTVNICTERGEVVATSPCQAISATTQVKVGLAQDLCSSPTPGDSPNWELDEQTTTTLTTRHAERLLAWLQAEMPALSKLR